MDKNGLNIIFMGTSDFGIPALEAINKSHNKIVGVVTLKDRRSGRGHKYIPTPIKKKAIQLNLPIFEIDSPKEPALKEYLKEKNADLSIVIAFQILPNNIIDIPKFGTINLHASLLPKYRGPAPINHAIINGENKTGNTIFFLNEKIDDGEILIQEELNIEKDENIGDVYKKLSLNGASIIIKALNLIEQQNFKTTMQDISLATKAPKIFKKDTIINWNSSATKIHNFIRGMSPYPGAMSKYNDKIIKILHSEIIETESVNNETGKISEINKESITITCKKGSIKILEIVPQGKKSMDIKSFINGYRPQKNEFFYQ